jgi:Lon protease-like protein
MSHPLLPLFPLQLVLFPGESLKLHIFEPRYKQLINDCQESGATFGIPTYFDKRVTEYGCEAAVVQVYQTYSTGEMDIRVEGRRAFHLDSFVRAYPGKLYSAGTVTWIENLPSEQQDNDEIWELHKKLQLLLGTHLDRKREILPNLSFALAHEIGMGLAEKLELLATSAEDERREAVLNHLRETTAMLEELAETKRRIQGNGQFHRFPEVDL